MPALECGGDASAGSAFTCSMRRDAFAEHHKLLTYFGRCFDYPRNPGVIFVRFRALSSLLTSPHEHSVFEQSGF